VGHGSLSSQNGYVELRLVPWNVVHATAHAGVAQGIDLLFDRPLWSAHFHVEFDGTSIR
jgi:hypothetical protein